MNSWENMTFQKHSKSWIVTSLVSRKKRILYRKCKNQKTKKIRSWRNCIRKNWFSPKYKNQLWKADFVFYAHLWIIFCQLFLLHYPASDMLPFLNLTNNTPFLSSTPDFGLSNYKSEQLLFDKDKKPRLLVCMCF